MRTLVEEDIIATNKNVYTQTNINLVNDPHGHDFFELFFVLKGSGIHLYNDAEIDVGVGDGYLLGLNDVHCLKPLSKDFVYTDIIFRKKIFQDCCNSFSPSLYSDISIKKYSNKFHLSNDDISILCQELDSYTNSSTNSEEKMFLEKRIAYRLILKIVEEQKITQSRYPIWVDRLTKSLSAPETFNLKLEQHMSNYSLAKTYMCRAFKKHTGYTIDQYYIRQKIIYANSLLTTTNYSISQICDMINIKNQSYFYRVYKAVYGVTPKKNRTVCK